ncbi:hypothetical protein [Leptospira yasudae]|uniref:Lipoprotein n=1 Tax=Leptospira yasudae TaxID=2202201 RepID=A0A6N4QX85_9LEPT|nr:hypothetical protein [Leptospira yasudae]TGL79085.1 hypothetical protein EHQ72_08910 [Leptospira yasudae]TGL83167.1 hypothetical protein EHQ77_02645 [Leptospira yasudae]TGL87427.1 hypothetical protein EHQ83_04395 [Leptospira yasudae]
MRISFFKTFFVTVTLVLLQSFCAFQTKQSEPGYVEVEVEGDNLSDAEKNAKMEMIRQVLGTNVESRSYLADSSSLVHIVETSEIGLVRRYRILETKYSKNKMQIRASGIVDEKRLEESIQEQYRLLGKPRILLLTSEKFGNEKTNSTRTMLESKLISQYPSFDFRNVSREEFKNLNVIPMRSKDADLFPVLEAARKSGGELLWIVDFTSKEGEKLAEGTELKSIFATIDFRLIEIVSGKTLVSGNLQGGKPAINLQYGSEKALDRLLVEMKTSLIKQLAEKWKRGNTIRIVLENVSYEDSVKNDLFQSIRTIKGVNSLNERGVDAQGRIVLEVGALLDGGKLFSILKQMEDRSGFSWEGKEIQTQFLLLKRMK